MLTEGVQDSTTLRASEYEILVCTLTARTSFFEYPFRARTRIRSMNTFAVNTVLWFGTTITIIASFCTLHTGNGSMTRNFGVTIALTLKTSQRIQYIGIDRTTQVSDFNLLW